MEASRNELTGRWSLSGVEPSEVTFERMCMNLREGINFKFARYGDGEFNCMHGKAGHNCDGHEYFLDMGDALNRAFYSDPKYMVGIQPLSVHGGLYQKAIAEKPGPDDIYDADVLHSASIDGKMQQFFDSLIDRDVVLVGPEHLKNVLACTWVIVPDKNCWLDRDRIAEEMYKKGNPESVFLLCASMMSEVLIDQFKHFRNHNDRLWQRVRSVCGC